MIEATQRLLADPSVLHAAVFCAAAIAGQVLHALKKWSEGEQWLLGNLRRTVGAVIGNLTAMAGFISTGTLTDIPALGTVIALGVFMGLSADSLLNKGAGRAGWSEAEREQRAGNSAAARGGGSAP